MCLPLASAPRQCCEDDDEGDSEYSATSVSGEYVDPYPVCENAVDAVAVGAVMTALLSLGTPLKALSLSATSAVMSKWRSNRLLPMVAVRYCDALGRGMAIHKAYAPEIQVVASAACLTRARRRRR